MYSSSVVYHPSHVSEMNNGNPECIYKSDWIYDIARDTIQNLICIVSSEKFPYGSGQLAAFAEVKWEIIRWFFGTMATCL